MTQLEERLRRGMKKYSERVRPEAIRPLREPSRAHRSRAVPLMPTSDCPPPERPSPQSDLIPCLNSKFQRKHGLTD